MRKLTIPALALALCAASVAPPRVLAGTTGTISGRVLDQDGRPVVAATVLVVGTRLGAYVDPQGDFTILNVPPGTYEVKVSRLGFNAVTVQEVVVSADAITKVDVAMGDTTLKAEEVVVVATRPPVDLKQTSSQANVTTEEIEQLPVQDLEDIVNLQAGVVDGHFRGGRQGEVQYQVDGVSVNNAFDNKSSLRIDRSLLQEVQVISGTFDAEYGQAMSGVVNAVLKQGTQEFEAIAEAYAGGFVFPGREGARRTVDTIHPLGTQNYQLTLTGPLPGRDVTYLLSGRRYVFDDYVYGERRFLPADRADFENQVYTPSGDGEEVALGYTREWSGAAQIAVNTFDDDKISYQVLFNRNEGRRTAYAFRLIPDALSTQETYSVAHGIDWTHSFGAATFLDFKVRQNYFKYEDFAYSDLYDERYDAAGSPESNVDYEDGAVVQGVQFGRYLQETNALILKAAVVSQVDA
ncbi:MAG: carboxypeptidase regulatory-like domain-containing protein, partial [Candidatus Krumholzibacteriia bacterium]